MRLIDADALNLDREVELADDWKTAHEIANCVKYAPTVDAVPVKHGNWEEPQPEGIRLYDKRSYAQCSVCKKKSYFGWKDNYCRYCGAKMDLEEQHD